MGNKDRIKFPSSNQRSSQSPDQKLGIHEIKATVHNGVIFAFIISLVSIACGAYMIIATDHEILGTLFSGAGLAPLVGNFLRDTRSHHNESKP